jgi:glycosyltransferase involved in cell wall biosynthesis
MYSVVILTLNEERDLPRCLASLSNCNDVVVLDSGSTDRTHAIAQEHGARVFERKFDDFAGQRNFAQCAIPFSNKWVFHLDADEQMTTALDLECRQAARAADVDGFLVAPKMIFRGRWIPHCTDFPAYQARFVRVDTFRFIQVGHGQREAPHMTTRKLKESYLHDLSSGGEHEWLEKHRRYAAAEAAQHVSVSGSFPWRDFASTDRLRRRRALKRLSYALPGRPALRFLYQYVIRRGFLDGRPGLRYCWLLSQYEKFTAQELRKRKRARGHR